MTRNKYKPAAFTYLNQWFLKDERYVTALSTGTGEEKLRALQDAAGFYRIARNLPRRHEDGPRFGGLLSILQGVETQGHTEATILNTVSTVGDQISARYGERGVLSATTKFLWLKLRSPVVIYDRQARLELGTRDGDVHAFYEAWRNRFRADLDEIREASLALMEVTDFCVRPAADSNYVESVVQSQWFHERVLDISLWQAGASRD